MKFQDFLSSLVVCTCACLACCKAPPATNGNGTVVPAALDASVAAPATKASAPATSAARDASAADAETCNAPHDGEEPSVTSADKRITIFVRTDPKRQDDTTTGDVPHEDLCIKTAGATTPRLLLAGRGSPEPEKTLAAFEHLLLSPDGKTLYFSTAGWVTSAAAHAIDLTTGNERSLIDGSILRIITSGKDKGHLVAAHYRLDTKYSVESPKYRGRMEMYSVITTDGTVVHKATETAP